MGAMKTTLEIPDFLFRRAKSAAAQRGIPLRQLVTEAGQSFTYVDLPTMPHSLHGADEKLYVDTLVEWARTIGSGPPA